MKALATILTLYLLVGVVMILAGASCSKGSTLEPPAAVGCAVSRFARQWNPSWKGPQANLALEATWADAHGDLDLYLRWWAMAPGESCFQILRYQPEVLQRTDYHGAHYDLLAQQARREGLVQWPEGMSWPKFHASKEWQGFKDHLRWHPHEGDALAFRSFRNLAYTYGLDDATAGWKVSIDGYRRGRILTHDGRVRGPFTRKQRRDLEAYWNGGSYLHQVRGYEVRIRERMKTCRQKAEKNSGGKR